MNIVDYYYYTIWTYSLVSTAISDCAAGIGIFDCSLCALNHSALRHVNEAIHRRVTRVAPSCFGRESTVGGTSPCEACLATVRCPPGRIFIPSLCCPFRSSPSLALVSLVSCLRGTGNFSRENSRHAPLQRIFSRARYLFASSENHYSPLICGTNLHRTSVQHGVWWRYVELRSKLNFFNLGSYTIFSSPLTEKDL